MAVSRQTLQQYASSVAAVAIATVVRHQLDPLLGDRAPLVSYLFAVSLISWLGGLGPGLFSLVLGGLVSDYLFIAPRASFRIEKLESQIGLTLYMITGLIIVLLADSQRSARRRAEEHAHEAIDRQVKLEAEIDRREQVEREREELLIEQARLRAVAEEQSATLASLIDQAPVGIAFYDADLRHVRANSQVAALFGQTPGRLIGRTLGEALAGIVAGARIAEIEALFRRTIASGEPFSAKGWASWVERIDHETVYLDWSIRRVDHPEGGTLGLLGTFVDVTEDIGRSLALRQSEERFRLAAEAVDGLIYDLDVATGRVERTRGLFELLGYQPEDVPPTLGWWLEQIHPEDIDRHLARDARRTGSPSRFGSEYRVRHREGHYLDVIDRSLATADEAGTIIRYVGCIQDVTEIRQADRRKNEFLAVLAHEIRNPLGSIRNSLRLMKGPETGTGTGEVDRESERGMAERQVTHLARLVDDLMDVSRITRGRIELRKEPIDLVGILARAIEAIRPAIERRGHALTVDLPPGPILLKADSTRLEQVFGNLLGNATKYTPHGGRIAVSTLRDGGEIVVTIRDSGLGIAAEMLPRVFEMFVQDKRHSGHTQGGLGIGLGLSKTLVELHGGKISAQSAGPGLGSEFEIRLPLAIEDLTEPGESAPSTSSSDPPPPPRRRVLVVDDNEAIAKSLAKLLERMYGQEVRVAHDGPSALELAGEFRPEVVLLDIGMPEMDGCEVARRLRKRPEFARTLLVALTGWGQESDRKRTAEAGIDRHLVKPIDPDVLGELITASRV